MENLAELQNVSNSLIKTYIGIHNGQQYTAVIKLGDPHGNGHEDFSITGTVYEKNAPRLNEKYVQSSGAIGDFLAKVNKNFALLNDLDLCDINGVPIHAIANMFYHIQNGFQRLEGLTNKEYFCKYYRITPEQYNILSIAKEQEDFTALFLTMPEILENWKSQAEKAINILEVETGMKFESKATSSNLILPNAEKIEVLKQRFNKGYYSKENIDKRAEQRFEDAKEKKINELRNKLNKEIHNKTQDTEIKIKLVELFGTHDNVIFYNHNGEICFNYSEPQYSTFSKKWTDNEIEEFKQNTSFHFDVVKKHNYGN